MICADLIKISDLCGFDKASDLRRFNESKIQE